MPHAITALIVTYNSAGQVGECVRAAMRWCDEVLVVDNASTDSTLAEVPAGARVIANRDNLGFAGGVNLGMREARHDLVLLLNPDAVLLDDPAPLVDENAAVAAGVLVDETARPQEGFTLRRFPTPAALALESLGINRLWPGNPVNRRWRALDCDLSRAQDAEQPAGAFLLIRREAWKAISGFDERFHPVWFEDVDFLIRLRKRGYRIRFQPKVRARHAGGHSVRQMAANLQKRQWYASLIQYAGKHFSPAQRRGVALAVGLGAALRWMASWVQGSAESRAAYGGAVRLAIGSLFG